MKSECPQFPYENLTDGQKFSVTYVWDANIDEWVIDCEDQGNPWNMVTVSYPLGSVHKGHVSNITDYGIFVELEEGVDGLVHMSDLSWDKRGEDAIRRFRKGDEVKAVVVDVDIERKRVSLSLKEFSENCDFKNFNS